MAKRMQSPSSINVYKQCPRKYYYQYILKIPTKPSIHLIRGSLVHEVLEKFFSIDLNSIDTADYSYGLRNYANACFLKSWRNSQERLHKLGLTSEQLEFYLLESVQMITKFVDNFSVKLKEEIVKTNDLNQAFKNLTPLVEEEIINTDLNVKGFIDAIHGLEDITIMDYKTSNKDDITPEYRLQLAIYALLYKLKYNKTPKKLGINFLKFGEKTFDVDESLLEEAKQEILLIHQLTERDHITFYPKKESGLCKWSSGKCDFYDFCLKQ